MPQPTVSSVHVNRPLTNMSIAMIQEPGNFVADQVFPNVPVAKQSDAFFSYDNAYWNRDEMKLRAPATESEGSGYAVDPNNTYYCAPYAFHKDIPDQLRGNADVPINPDAEATQYVTLKALIKREKLFAARFLAGSVWTRDYDGVASGVGTNEVLQWNDSDSTPIEDVWDAKQDILERTGFEPNVLCIGYPVLKALINHPDIVDRVKYGNTSGPAMIDLPELQALFKIPKIVVMRAISNTAMEGATKSHSFIGGKKALLCYAASAPSIMQPSAGYHFTWTQYPGGAGPSVISRFRMEHLKSDRIEIELNLDCKLIAADLGSFWDSIVA